MKKIIKIALMIILIAFLFSVLIKLSELYIRNPPGHYPSLYCDVYQKSPGIDMRCHMGEAPVQDFLVLYFPENITTIQIIDTINNRSLDKSEFWFDGPHNAPSENQTYYIGLPLFVGRINATYHNDYYIIVNGNASIRFNYTYRMPST